MNIKFKLVDDYTKEIYNIYKVSKSYLPEEIYHKYGEKYVIYSPFSTGKFLKYYDKESGKVEFTDKLGYALLFKNLIESRQIIMEITNGIEKRSNYFIKIVGSSFERSKLKSCCIETEFV